MRRGVILTMIGNKSRVISTISIFLVIILTLAACQKDNSSEITNPEEEEVIIEDPHTKEQMIIDPSVVKKQYAEISKERDEKLKRIFRDSMVDYEELSTEESFSPNVASFLKRRSKKRKYISS